jgi:hypothetical protein
MRRASENLSIPLSAQRVPNVLLRYGARPLKRSSSEIKGHGSRNRDGINSKVDREPLVLDEK